MARPFMSKASVLSTTYHPSYVCCCWSAELKLEDDVHSLRDAAVSRNFTAILRLHDSFAVEGPLAGLGSLAVPRAECTSGHMQRAAPWPFARDVSNGFANGTRSTAILASVTVVL
jgi:hypothetical protein